MSKDLYSLGLMSGTSADGVDVSIIKSDGEQFLKVIDDEYLEYDKELKLKLKKITKLSTSKEEVNKFSKEINQLEREITLYHNEACKLIMKKIRK